MRRLTSILALFVGGWLVAAVSSVEIRAGQAQRAPSTTPSTPQALVDQYCITCHNQRLRTAGLALDTLDAAHPSANPEVWERVIGKLRAQSMPPPGRPRPDGATYRTVATTLEREIDRGVGRTSEAGTHRRGAPVESHRVHERHSRPVRARPRRTSAAARRRDRRRQLRQPRRRALDFNRASRALPLRRATGDAHRNGSAADKPTHRDVRDSDSRAPGRSTERGSAVRIERRYRDSHTTSPFRASTSSRFDCSVSIRTTSKAWGGRSNSTFAWTESS